MVMKKDGAGWNRKLRSVIVGVDKASGEVCRIRVQKDGIMVHGVTIHHPVGQIAFAEALRVFGLVHAREFTAAQLDEAAIYAEELMQDALQSNPQLFTHRSAPDQSARSTPA